MEAKRNKHQHHSSYGFSCLNFFENATWTDVVPPPNIMSFEAIFISLIFFLPEVIKKDIKCIKYYIIIKNSNKLPRTIYMLYENNLNFLYENSKVNYW